MSAAMASWSSLAGAAPDRRQHKRIGRTPSRDAPAMPAARFRAFRRRGCRPSPCTRTRVLFLRHLPDPFGQKTNRTGQLSLGAPATEEVAVGTAQLGVRLGADAIFGVDAVPVSAGAEVGEDAVDAPLDAVHEHEVGRHVELLLEAFEAIFGLED